MCKLQGHSDNLRHTIPNWNCNYVARATSLALARLGLWLWLWIPDLALLLDPLLHCTCRMFSQMPDRDISPQAPQGEARARPSARARQKTRDAMPSVAILRKDCFGLLWTALDCFGHCMHCKGPPLRLQTAIGPHGLPLWTTVECREPP